MIRFGDRYRAQDFAACQARQPGLPLFFGATGKQGASDNFWTRDQASPRTERVVRELLGDYDHRQGVVVIVRLQSAVTLWNGDAEQTHFGGRTENGFRNVEVVTMNFFGERRDLVGAELRETVADEFLLVIQQRRPEVASPLDDLRAQSRHRTGSECVAAQRAHLIAGEVVVQLLVGESVVRWARRQSRAHGMRDLGAELIRQTLCHVVFRKLRGVRVYCLASGQLRGAEGKFVAG